MFYIYEHIRPDTKAVFYVGKGSQRRMHSKYRRNSYWKNIVSKANGFTVKEIFKHENEELVFLVEQERIDQLKKLGIKLANLTNGGEGTSGFKHSEEFKLNMSLIKKGIPLNENQIRSLKEANTGRKLTDEIKKKISISTKGGKNCKALTVEYKDKRFDCIKDLASFLNKKYSSVFRWTKTNPEKYGIKIIGKTKDLK